MQAQVTPLDGSKAIGITFTDKPVTAFGGLALFVAFAQLAVLQADVPVRQLFGLTRFPSTATFTRFFRRFTPKTITDTFEPLWTWGLARLPARLRSGGALTLSRLFSARFCEPPSVEVECKGIEQPA